MKEIPASKNKKYRKDDNPESQEGPYGLARYFDMILKPTLVGRDIGRILLIDHSGSGQSVDGWYTAFLDSISAEWGHTAHLRGEDWTRDPEAMRARQFYAGVPIYLINVVDQKGRQDGNRPAIAPTLVPVLDIIVAGRRGEVNRLVGNEAEHHRGTPDYPPSQWEIPIKQSW